MGFILNRHHKMNVIIYIDGGSRGNPGMAGAGVVILDRETSQPLVEVGYFLGRMTNNAAEYHGLIRALEAADRIGANRLDIRSDSQLMVRQVTGQYRVKSDGLRPLYERVKRLLTGFDDWRMTHVYRESNQRADQLANQAMDARADVAMTQL